VKRVVWTDRLGFYNFVGNKIGRPKAGPECSEG
jgi:hypothetical protein